MFLVSLLINLPYFDLRALQASSCRSRVWPSSCCKSPERPWVEADPLPSWLHDEELMRIYHCTETTTPIRLSQISVNRCYLHIARLSLEACWPVETPVRDPFTRQLWLFSSSSTKGQEKNNSWSSRPGSLVAGLPTRQSFKPLPEKREILGK